MTLPAFGVNLGRLADPPAGATSGEFPDEQVPPGPVAAARWAEARGFDVVTAADHVGAPSPFVQLAAAAAATSRVRLRTYVLDVGFWNPVLLARDVATLDVVSGGRVDLGLGAGHQPAEHAEAGLPFPAYPQRLEQLDAFATAVRAALDDPAHRPAPVQRPVPLFVAAMSARGLAVAARHGDVVGLAGAVQVPGAPAGTFALASSDLTDERLGEVRQTRAGLGLPPATVDVLLQLVSVGRDPERVAAELAEQFDGAMTAAELLDCPFVLLADTPADAVAELVRRTDRWGVSSWCTHTPSGPALARVLDLLRADPPAATG